MSPNLKTAALFQLCSIAMFVNPTVGAFVAVGAVAVHLLWIRRTRAEVLTVALFAVGGAAYETLLMRGGLVVFTSPSAVPGLCPLWIVTFWAALGMLANGPLEVLRERQGLAVLAGFLGAPLSFWGTQWLGALTLARPLPQTLLGVSLATAVTFGALFEGTRRVNGRVVALRW